MEPGHIVLIVWLLLPIVLFLLIIWMILSNQKKKKRLTRLERELANIKERFRPIISMDEEIEKLKSSCSNLHEMSDALSIEYADKIKVFKNLSREVAAYEEKIAFAELGVYEPHFDFSDSEAFKAEIRNTREQQKQLISRKEAAICPANWTVDGSASKGATMINRQMRLTMRAFNNECEAAISNTRWNNINAMENRVLNSAKQINSANESMTLSISPNYVALKIRELRLTHEYKEKQKLEREEKAELARAAREEKKLLSEAKRAMEEEAKYQNLLTRARLEAGADESRIAELERALEAAHAASERAKAMAEMTKSGYVYIISNIGSFGEQVVKIGLTRRLDPYDRVKELGDASVPFKFDTHAMIYSDQAPALENALHNEFEDRRINTSNYRKEFFKVSLDEVENAVARLSPTASFFKDREAQEWNETVSRRNRHLESISTVEEDFPSTI